MKDFRNKWALVTGASSGLGADFARQLAAEGMNVIITARREDRLNELAEELRTAHGVDVHVIAADLTALDQPHELLRQIQAHGKSIDLLINNAGFGLLARFAKTDPSTVDQMIDLNVRICTQLVYGLIPGMIARGGGAVINVASTASFQPVVYMPVYGATKAFVLSLSEALWSELRKHNVHVMALCPGFTKTEFFEVARVRGWQTKFAHTSPQVVRAAIRALKRRKPVLIVGWLNWLVAQFPRLIPRAVLARMSAFYMRPK